MVTTAETRTTSRNNGNCTRQRRSWKGGSGKQIYTTEGEAGVCKKETTPHKSDYEKLQGARMKNTDGATGRREDIRGQNRDSDRRKRETHIRGLFTGAGQAAGSIRTEAGSGMAMSGPDWRP
jgi:hypothetical protein